MRRLAVPSAATVTRPAVLRLVWVSVCCLGLCGSASYWDEFTLKDFWHNPWGRQPDPVAVLHDPAADGNQRYRALANVPEPAQNGGTQQAQDDIYKIVEKAATQDPVPVCRLAALAALGRFKDPRAAACVDGVFDQQLPFTKDMNTLIREQCLSSLIEIGGPVALQRLVLVAKEPPSTGPAQEYQETLDRQLIAVRGLAKFKEPQATGALAYVLCAKKNDVALRDRAHESLVACTGKDLPADSQVWQSYLPPPSQDAVQQTSGKH